MSESLSCPLLDILFDQRVCVVGGADEIDWKAIDTADLVVRINNHFVRQGGAVDIVYSAGVQPVPVGLEGVEYISYNVRGTMGKEWKDFCFESGILSFPFDNQVYATQNPNGADYEWLTTFNREIQAKPFTGILAIRHLLSFPINRLAITGFSFYNEDSIPDKRDAHWIPSQIEWLDFVVKTDLRVRPDGVLRNILEGYKR